MTAVTPRIRRPNPLKTWRLASFGVAWFALAWAALDIRMMFVHNVPLASDAKCYWMEWHGPLYDATASLWLGHFNYSPVATLAFWPLAQLPLTAFTVVWIAIGTAAYVWLLALVAIFGLRWPALWLVTLFTKITPFVGFGWFVIRGEWRRVAWTAGLAVALVAISALLLPDAWPKWVGMLRTLGSEAQATTAYNSLMPPISLAARGLAAVVLVWWGARNNRPVVLPLVLALSQPDWQPWAFGILAAVPRLLRLPEQSSEEAVSPTLVRAG